MLWVYCVSSDSVNAVAGNASAPPVDPCGVLMRFFAVLALWPWPLPFSTRSMDALVAGERHGSIPSHSPPPPPLRLDGSVVQGSAGAAEFGRTSNGALDGCAGRRLLTNFVVPLPSAVGGLRYWNMTQAVQTANQRFITREAWIASMQVSPPECARDYREEMRAFSLTRHSGMGRLLVRWPLYLSVTFPPHAPPEWQGIAASRLMPVLLPQLDVSGFTPRPLCCDRPAYMILIWPHDAVWSVRCYREIILPLGERLLPTLYASLHAAYRILQAAAMDAGRSAALPPLERLLPVLDVHLCDL